MSRLGDGLAARALVAFGAFVAFVIFVVSLAFHATAADAAVIVNKSFTPSSVGLGAISTVMVQLQNTSTVTPAKITSFTDDITTMAGKALIATPNNLSTTCVGGTPTIAGQVVSMKNGTIPIAPSSTVPGTCFVTFNVIATAVGNGVNTLPVGALQTDQGQNATPASQTLQVLSAIVGITASAPTTVLTTQGTTQTFTITNPTAGPLNGLAFPISASGTNPFSITSATTSCGGTVALTTFPAKTGTASASGLTVPANGTCTVTLNLNVPPGSPDTTVNLNVPAGAITDPEGISNAVPASTSAKFISALPNLGKTFAPNSVVPGDTTRLSVTIKNNRTTALTNAAFTDALPAGLTLDAAPAPTFVNCGTPTVAGAGTATLRFSGATIPPAPSLGAGNAASTCTVTVTVDVAATAAGSLTNTIPAAALTNTQGLAAAGPASATLTVITGGLGASKSFSPGSAPRLTPVTTTLTFRNVGTTPLTAGTFTDNLPQTPVPLVAVPATPPTFTGCGTTPAVTFPTNTTVRGTGLTIAVGGTCTVKFTVQFASGSPSNTTVTNTIPAANIAFTNGTGGTVNAGPISANLTNTPTFTIKNYLASASGLTNQPLTVQGQIVDQAAAGVTDTGVAATFLLNTGANANVKLAPAPNFVFGPGCPGGLSAANIVIGAGGLSFTVNIPSLGSSCTISYNVINATQNATGTFPAGGGTYTSAQNGGTTTTAGGTNTVSFLQTSLLVNKTFVPDRIASAGTSTLNITLAVQGIATIPTTQANGVTFQDTLPANLSFATPPNITFSPNCQQTGQPAPAGKIAGSTLTVTNVSLLAVLTRDLPCTVTVDTTSEVLGNVTNTIPAGAVTSTSGATNSGGTSASLSVVAGVALRKSFLTGSFPIGGTDFVRLEILNSSVDFLVGGTLTDTLPSQLVLASTTAQPPAQPGDPPSCGGTLAGTVGSGTFSFSGLRVGPALGSATPGTCVEYVQVTSSATATPSTAVNTIPPGGLVIGGLNNSTPATADVILTAPPNPNLTKAFAPASIIENGTSVLTISVANTAAGATALTGLALTDTLPAGVIIATTPNGSTTCTGGTVTATAGGTSVALAGGTVAAAATCTISVTVTSATPGTYTNTIPTGSLTSTQGATNGSPATAVLTVTAPSPVVLSKAFAPASIFPTGVSTLTIGVANTGTNAIALTGVALTDTLPAGVTIAAPAGGATTCPAGIVTATPGGASVALAGANLAIGATCTITVSVTSTTIGTFPNTIPAGAVTSTQGVSNTAPASATLTVAAAPPATIAKTFTPATILTGGISTLSIAITSPNPLTGLALVDTLPAGVTIAPTPNASTTCTGGTVTATAGGTNVALTGGTLTASCTISVSVTGATAGSFTNTIPARALTSTQGATNTAPASAVLVVQAPPPVVLTKAFTPPSITVNGTSSLTVTIANTNAGAIALTGLRVTDALPAGVTIAATPNGSTTCAGGAVTATAGASTFALAGGGVAAAATCTVTVSVTSAVAGSYTNTIPASAVGSTQGVTNTAPATAVLAVTAPPTNLTKAFSPTAIVTGATSTLTISIPNTSPGAVALTGLALTDTLPAGVAIAPTPNASTTCVGGTVAATAGGATVALAGGTVAAGATCTITVTVTGTTVGAHTNTIPAGALRSTQGATNTAPATAVLAVSAPFPVTISKAFSPVSVTLGGTSTLSVLVSNTGTGAIPLTTVGLTDILPAGVTVAPIPNASTTCGAGTVTATPGRTSVALAGGAVTAGATCTITVSVAGTVVGAHLNTIPAGALTTAQGATNTAPATATLTVTAPPVTLSKVFTPATIISGATSRLEVRIANQNTAAVALTALAVTDALPAGVTLAPAPNGVTTCGAGTVTAIAGAASFALAGGTLAAGAVCTVDVTVTSTSVATHTNTIPASAVTSAEGSTNLTPASADLTVVAPSPVSLTKAFVPASIVSGGTSTLTIGVVNTAANAIALSGLGLTDTLPAGVTIAPAPNASTTCAGTVSAVAGGATVALAGGTIAAAATCTISVSVTSTKIGVNTNTIPTGAVASTQGVTNTAPATANLTVTAAPPVALTKAFAPASIVSGATSTLTITVANASPGAVALTGLALTDTLPAGVTVAATPNASTTCVAGTVTATAGGASVALAGGRVAAGASCTITLSVTGTTTGTYINTIPTGALTSTQGATNSSPATATLTIGPKPTVTVSKGFAPASISPGATSTATITLSNTAAGAVVLTNVALTDNLPSGLVVAPSPNASTTCAAGTVTAARGGTVVALSGGSIPAGGTCTIVVPVTGPSVGTFINAIPAGAVTSAQGGTNGAPAQATLTIVAPSLRVSKTIDGKQSETVVAGQIVTYAMTVTNPSTAAAANVTLTDPVPTGLTPIAGSVTLDGAAVPGATISGQTVTVPIGTFAGGRTAIVAFKATVGTNLAGPAVNVASVTATGQPAPATSNPATANIVRATLRVTKLASATVVRVGDRVDFAITIVAPPGAAFNTTTVIDVLPQFQTYAAGSARVNGRPFEPSVSGRTLTWTLPNLSGTVTLTYSVAIAPGAPQNATLTNTVNVTAVPPAGGTPATGGASASVQVIGSTFGSCYPITGRVYVDEKDSGHFEDGDTGLANVRIYLDDGETVLTDEFGRYNFPCVRPGMHAMRLDDTTLPDGVTPFADHNIDSERSIRRLIHSVFDTTVIQDINFAVKGTAPQR